MAKVLYPKIKLFAAGCQKYYSIKGLKYIAASTFCQVNICKTNRPALAGRTGKHVSNLKNLLQKITTLYNTSTNYIISFIKNGALPGGDAFYIFIKPGADVTGPCVVQVT